MRPFSTLSAKILFWFFLNLAIIACVFVAHFTIRFQKDFHNLLGKHARDRMRTASRIISHELERAPESQWQEILARHSEIHQVELAVATGDRRIGPSDDFSIPPKVETAVEKALAFDFRRARKKFRRERFERPRSGTTENDEKGHRDFKDRPPG